MIDMFNLIDFFSPDPHKTINMILSISIINRLFTLDKSVPEIDLSLRYLILRFFIFVLIVIDHSLIGHSLIKLSC